MASGGPSTSTAAGKVGVANRVEPRPVARDTGPMQEGKYGVNSITVGATELLLTSAGGGMAVHLAPVADTGAAQAAVPDYCFTPEAARRRPGLVNYDHDALRAARWSETTLCGRAWGVMVGGDGGSISPWGADPEFAPTCKRCLALMDRMFPSPPAHPQLPLIVRVVSDSVADHGYAEVHDVPGDQQTELRRRIRALVRKETGHSCQSLVHESMVVVVCEPIAQLHREEERREAAQRMGELLFSGEPVTPRPDPEWRHSWSTWAVD